MTDAGGYARRVTGSALETRRASVSLIVRDPARPGGGPQVLAALTNRTIPIEPLGVRVLRACGQGGHE